VPTHRSTRCDCIRLAQVFGTSISRNVTAEIHSIPHLVFRLLFWYPAILPTETWPNSRPLFTTSRSIPKDHCPNFLRPYSAMSTGRPSGQRSHSAVRKQATTKPNHPQAHLHQILTQNFSLVLQPPRSSFTLREISSSVYIMIHWQ
jgi:hypothetical protein